MPSFGRWLLMTGDGGGCRPPPPGMVGGGEGGPYEDQFLGAKGGCSSCDIQMENEAGFLEQEEDPSGMLQGAQRDHEAMFLKVDGDGRLLDNSGVHAMKVDGEQGGSRDEGRGRPVVLGTASWMKDAGSRGSVGNQVIGRGVGVGPGGGWSVLEGSDAVRGGEMEVGSVGLNEDVSMDCHEEVRGSVLGAADVEMETGMCSKDSSTLLEIEVSRMDVPTEDGLGLAVKGREEVSSGCRSQVQWSPVTEGQMLDVSPEDLCMGSSQDRRSTKSGMVASRTNLQSVCGNAQRGRSLVQAAGDGQGESLLGQGGAGCAWLRPRMVALPPSVELGKFSLDGITVTLDSAEVEATSRRLAAALVGRLFGRRIPFNVLSGELRRRWAAYGTIRIITLTGDCFLCVFDSIEARNAVMLGGPWVVLGQVIGMDYWTPSFSPESSVAFSTPVWVRMPRLPLYCWSLRNIARIAAMVGEPMWTDGATADLE